jgi:hypothetical protein
MFFGRHLTMQVSLVVLLCMVSTCLLSVPVGPYSAVHGPVTAFRALRASIVMFWSIVVAAFTAIRMRPLRKTAWAPLLTGFGQIVFRDLQLSSVLRC